MVKALAKIDDAKAHAKTPDQVVKKLQAAWSEYQRHGVDKHGLDFGKKLFDLRAGSEVVQGGTTFASSLDEAKIPRRTAYYWIHNYEISIGVREPDKPKAKQSEPDQTVKEPAQSAEPEPSCNIHGVPFTPTPRDIYWVPPANPPAIKGWSSMDAGGKHRAGQEAGCKYCLTYSSARSCPAHGWTEKRHDHETPLIPFEPQQEMALQIINDGFKARSAEEPEKQRLIQAAKTWAHARLSSTELNAPTPLTESMMVSIDGKKFTLKGMSDLSRLKPNATTVKGTVRLQLILVPVVEAPAVTTKPTVTKQLQQGKKVDLGKRADGHRTDDKYCARCHSQCVQVRHEQRMATDPEYAAEYGGGKVTAPTEQPSTITDAVRFAMGALGSIEKAKKNREKKKKTAPTDELSEPAKAMAATLDGVEEPLVEVRDGFPALVVKESTWHQKLMNGDPEVRNQWLEDSVAAWEYHERMKTCNLDGDDEHGQPRESEDEGD
jgi:hypothetical protein